VLAQIGFGQHAWTMDGADPEAVAFFQALPGRIRAWLFPP
jgi:hypothetical protein